MTENKINYQNRLFFITIFMFALGFLHISFAIMGLLCFITPFILFGIYKDKVWCKYFCPRAGFLNNTLSKISLRKPLPKWLTTEKMRNIVLTYFGMNIFFITMSTLMVALGRISPIDRIRFMIVFQLPFEMPQVLKFAVSDTLLHLGYRVYSVMFTSTVLGLILGFIYAPRTWCAICPVQTLTTPKKAIKNI